MRDLSATSYIGDPCKLERFQKLKKERREILIKCNLEGYARAKWSAAA